MTRFFDILFSFIGLILFLPFFIVIALLIVFDSKGGVFYLQPRAGKDKVNFLLIKFRTMHTGAEQIRSLTVGSRDSRITRIGYRLRKYKLDELPQLINVLKGDMSLVGPRPELWKYVNMYTEEQNRVFRVRPGITDWASIEYINENEILGASAEPEKTYIEEIMPAKIRLNMRYIDNPGLGNYFNILWMTFIKIF